VNEDRTRRIEEARRRSREKAKSTSRVGGASRSGGTSRTGRTSRRQAARAEEVDLRPVGADGSRPPKLEFYLLRRLKILALANVFPLIAGAIITYLYLTGRIYFKMDGNQLLWAVLFILLAIVVLCSSVWVFFPLARWMRRYPHWHFKHTSKLLWFLPMVCGYLAWIAIWLLGAGLSAAAIFFLVTGIWDLGEGAWEANRKPDQEVAG